MPTNLQHKIDNYTTLARGLKTKPTTGNSMISKTLLMALPITGTLAIVPTTDFYAQSSSVYMNDLNFTTINNNATLDVPGFGIISLYISNPDYGFYSVRDANGNVLREPNPAGGFRAAGFAAGVTKTTGDTNFPTNAPDLPANHLSAGQYVFIKNGSRIGWLEIKQIGGGKIIFDSYASTSGTSITSGQPGVLPVELGSFTASTKEEMIQLNWQTISEQNNAGFELQRGTTDKNFKTVTFIEGKGTTTEKQEYFYDDKEIRSNRKYYYRLKQIDYDGQFEYSEVLIAQINGNSQDVSDFYPNPTVTGSTNVDYFATTSGTVTIEAYDVSGKKLYHQSREVHKGLNPLQLDVIDLGTGTFFIKFEQGEESVYKKLFIKK